MKIVLRNPADLIGAEYNPRNLTKKQHKEITDSLKRFGFAKPVIVNKHKDRNDILIGGHQRVRCAIDLGMTEIPTVEMKLTLEQEKELNIRLNKNTGEWDFDQLANNFEVADLLDWGFEPSDLDFYEPENEDEELDDISDDLETEFKIEVTVDNEEEQEKLYNRLKEEGLECKILTL